MNNSKRLLWQGSVVIEGEGVPGLALGESVDVGIFLEEASKWNEVNFDWDLARKKEAKFRRFPRWALNSRNKKKGLEPLDSYVKNSCIVKVARLGAGDDQKFSRLVQSLIKSDNDSFCGFLRVEEANLRPLCLMVTERGLLGFCVDHPRTQEEGKNVSSGPVSVTPTTLYTWWENKLEENYRIGREGIEEIVMTREEDKSPENNKHTEKKEYCENAQLNCDSDKELHGSENHEHIEKQGTSQSTTCTIKSMETDSKHPSETTDFGTNLDWKLFVKTSVKIEKLSSAEIRSFIENDGGHSVSLEIGYKLQPCAENNNQDEICSNNNLLLTETTCSGGHLKLNRIGASISRNETNNCITKLDCKICGQLFLGWQERHEHYLEVHGD